MILAILAIWFGYRKAKDTGRNAIIWAAICGFTYIGIQLLVNFGAGLILGIGIELWGWSETLYDDLAWVITLVAIGASILGIYLIFRYLDKVSDEPMLEPPSPPPPPPSFDQE